MNILLSFLLCCALPLVSSVGLYQQCGGEGYKGSTSCDWPLTCYRRSRWFSSCQTQCPGGDWDCAKLVGTGGPSGGTTLAKAWEQCGGEGWNGPRLCAEYPCQWRTKWYAQCRPDCPAGWMCQGSQTTVKTSSTVVTTTPAPLPPTTTEKEESGEGEGEGEGEENIDDDADFGRYIVSQMLGSSAFDFDLHAFEAEDMMDLYDIVVEHIIKLLESEEPGCMGRFGAALQSDDIEERIQAWHDMYERVHQLASSAALMEFLMTDGLFVDQWDDDVYEEYEEYEDEIEGQTRSLLTRTLRKANSPCNGPTPDLGKVNGLYGNGQAGYAESLADAMKGAGRNLQVNAAILAAVESGIGPKPDPESRLGAFYATLGYPEDTVGNSVNRAIRALYLFLGPIGEEKIGRVFNDPQAKALFNKPIKSWYSRCMAEVEYRYWANVKRENPKSAGAFLGEAAKPHFRDCIQQALTLSFCWKKPKSTPKSQQSIEFRQGLVIPAGYTKRNYLCQNKPVYCNSKAPSRLQCIVEDRTSHKGGVWKAGPEKAWAEQGCPSNLRSGTYDADLNRIAD